MTHRRSAQAHRGSATPDAPREVRQVLFKDDRPRGIDRYIDYFGSAADLADPSEDDARGETRVARLA